MSLHNRKSLEPYIRDDVEFYQHQVEGVRIMWNMPSFLLADDMGLGKTMQTLAVFGLHCKKTLEKRGRHSTMLVVCPPSLKANWAEEIVNFTRIPYVVVNGDPKKRLEQIGEFMMMEGSKILIMNYEQVGYHLAELNYIKFDCVAADECHAIKNPEAARTDAFLKLNARRSFMLTGSPLLNNVHELWTILNRVQPGKWGTYNGYRQKFCVIGGSRGQTVTGVKNEHILKKALTNIMIRRLKDDVLDLPEVQIIGRTVELLPIQRRLYDQAISDLEVEVAHDKTIPIKNPGTKILRLKQICGTTATLLENGEDHSAKLDLAIEDAEEIVYKGNKLVVFTQFRPVVQAYVDRCTKAFLDVPVFQLHGDVKVGDRQSIVHEWAAVKGPAIIVCMLQVAGTGFNMTAARYCQFLDKQWVPMLNKQAIDRLNRIGASKTQNIQVLEYRAARTVDSRIETVLKTKKDIFDQIVENPNTERQLLRDLVNEAKASKARAA